MYFCAASINGGFVNESGFYSTDKNSIRFHLNVSPMAIIIIYLQILIELLETLDYILSRTYYNNDVFHSSQINVFGVGYRF